MEERDIQKRVIAHLICHIFWLYLRLYKYNIFEQTYHQKVGTKKPNSSDKVGLIKQSLNFINEKLCQKESELKMWYKLQNVIKSTKCSTKLHCRRYRADL